MVCRLPRTWTETPTAASLSDRPPPLLPFFLGLGAGWGEGCPPPPPGASRVGEGSPLPTDPPKFTSTWGVSGVGWERAAGCPPEQRGWAGRWELGLKFGDWGGGLCRPPPWEPKRGPRSRGGPGGFQRGRAAPRRRPQTRRSGARGWRQAASFVYLTAKYQGNHRLAALPPTPTAKTNSWAKRMPLLS